MSAKTYDGKIAGLYDLEETLGRGHFAVVKLARHVFTGEKVAVKVIDKTKLDEVSKAHLFQEVRCMKLVQHPNVVRLYEVIDTQTKLYLILELGDGGDLYDYIMRHECGLGEERAKEYFRQIVRAISYCHQLHVVHRDLKPENVVFFEKLGVVKLTDFGFSNKFCPGQKLETSCGSLAYSAPEILLGDSYDAPAVDIWSLGVILYMLVVGQAPFQEANDSETLTMIMDCKYTIPSHVSEECKNLIGRMLVRIPESRATLQEIASDTWLGGLSQAEFLPLVSRQQVSEEGHNFIINKMVNGNIATKEDILEALDKNEYNHITATYFLLAERKLRSHRQELAQNRMKQHQILNHLATNSKSSLKVTDTISSDTLEPPATTSVLNIPRTPGDTQSGRIRKCSIVQEENDDDEEEYGGSGGEQLSSAHSSLNRRGSRSEGKLNVAVQERIAEERRKKEKDSPSGKTSPQTAILGINHVGVRDDSSSANTNIVSTTAYIPGTTKWRMGAHRSSSTETNKLDNKYVSEKLKQELEVRKKEEEKENIRSPPSWKKEESIKSPKSKIKLEKQNMRLPISSHVKLTIQHFEKSDPKTITLTESSTVTIPLNATHTPENSLSPKFRTMPSPTRVTHSFLSSPQLNEICEEGVFEVEKRSSRIGITGINYEQRRSKFHKARTASCSSSDASDDDSESRKKRAHKIPTRKNNQRRDSHDDSSDSQDPGGSGGAGGNPSSGTSGHTDCNQSSQNQNNTNSSNEQNNTNNTNHRQCSGDNFRRNRRRAGETRLRESQSLNRITEVQESEVHPVTEVHPAARETIKTVSKSFGAKLLHSWSAKKYERCKKLKEESGSPDKTRTKEEEKENQRKVVVEKTGKKVKLLGRYFQMSRKLGIPLPSLVSKGRLYKARSCGSIVKDRITSPTPEERTMLNTLHGPITNTNTAQKTNYTIQFSLIDTQGNHTSDINKNLNLNSCKDGCHVTSLS